ncbi:hypothetical protein Patl1_34936 [Pistacia atlantica]|uniref:Uncharacterized protein n=1 Tax=Pistacia atlantica TaxID=434234 RepID=A0ACC0ZR70_9ROSI|nr:hypothetical protein Patl1_34936 [Pistacia atlantica]
MNSMRPNIAYDVTRLSRYTHNPDKSHWIALDRVARYLKGTIDYGLTFGSTPPILEGYSNANWISNSDEKKIHKWLYLYTWWRCCVMEVFQKNLHSSVYHGV